MPLARIEAERSAPLAQDAVALDASVPSEDPPSKTALAELPNTAASVPAAKPPSKPPDIDITTTWKSPPYLRCPKEYQPNVLELVGDLTITITNRTDQPIQLLKLETEAVVFENESSRAQHVATHICSCVQLLLNPMSMVHRLGPRQSATIKIDGPWSHEGGPFPAPDPGQYTMHYRAVIVTDPIAPHRDAHSNFSQLTRVDTCQSKLSEMLADQLTVSSSPIPVTLSLQGPRRNCLKKSRPFHGNRGPDDT